METLELQARGQVGEKGRIVIPSEIREALGIAVGATRWFFGWKTTNCAFRLCASAFGGRKGVCATSLRLEPWFPRS